VVQKLHLCHSIYYFHNKTGWLLQTLASGIIQYCWFVMTWVHCKCNDIDNANVNNYSWYFARLLRNLLRGSSTDRRLCRQSPITPTWCSSPRLVCDTNSAAPPIGFVTTPISPLLIPDTKPVAVPDTVPQLAVCTRVKTCSGWSAMPASAPKQSQQCKLWNKWLIAISVWRCLLGSIQPGKISLQKSPRVFH